MKLVLIFIHLGFVVQLFGQTPNEAVLMKDEVVLKQLLDDLRATPNSDKDSLIAKNDRFKAALKTTLAKEGAFDYPFESLSKSVGFIKSSDNVLRIINWNIEFEGFSYEYAGFVMIQNIKKKKVYLHPMIDNPEVLSPRTDEVLDLNNWYGALYYSIVTKNKGNKIYYTLLGWDGRFQSSNMKIVDVLTINGANVRLGAPIFKTKEGLKKRLIFEYSEKASMSLKYEIDYDRITFDHLSPEEPGLEGLYSYYVPDMSYDALKFEDGIWQMKEDVIAINKNGDKTKKILVQNPKTGKLEEKEIKDEFEAPAENLETVLPEEEVKKQKEKSKKTKKVKKDDRDPSKMESTLGTRKRK